MSVTQHDIPATVLGNLRIMSYEDNRTSLGMKLLKQCSEQIDRVEKQVMKLNEEGGLEPLDPQ